jgi:hypothetical protein
MLISSCGRTFTILCQTKCFAMLRQLRSIRRSVPASAYQTLIMSSVLTILDYGNAVLSGLPAHLIRRLQSVMNAAARSIAGLRRSEHIITTLAGLHWLRASERIDFKLATLTYRHLHGAAPSYLSCDLRRLADIPSRRRQRSAAVFGLQCIGRSTNQVVVRWWPNVRCRCLSSLKQSSCHCHICVVYPCLPSASENSPLQTVLSRLFNRIVDLEVF